VDPLTAGVIVLAVVVALLFAAWSGLYRRVRELELATYHGIGVRFGAEPDREGLPGIAAPTGTTFVLKLNRQCPVCDELVLEVGSLAPKLPSGYSFTLLSDDPQFDKPVPTEVRIIRDLMAWRSVTVPYAPALLIVDEQGIVVLTAPVGSRNALLNLVEKVLAKHREVPK
jgi:hypothetical protein